MIISLLEDFVYTFTHFFVFHMMKIKHLAFMRESPLMPHGDRMEDIMTLDKNSLNMLLSLDDEHLAKVIRSLASNAGIPTSSLSFSPEQLKGIRQALSMATDGDISRAAELIKGYKQGKRS